MDCCDIAWILAIGCIIVIPIVIILLIILVLVIVNYRFKGKLNPKTEEVSTEFAPEEKVKIEKDYRAREEKRKYKKKTSKKGRKQGDKN